MTPQLPIIQFGLDAATMDSSARNVLSGDKRATTGLFAAYAHDGEALPVVGDRSIVRDSHHRDVAIIEVTRVEVRRFCDVDAAFALIEGEGDKSLSHWQKVHWDYLSQVSARINIPLTPETKVVLEYFTMVKPLTPTLPVSGDTD